MARVVLGRTEIAINPLVYGSLPLGPLQAGLTPAEGARLMRHALEREVNLVDTAKRRYCAAACPEFIIRVV